MLNERLLSHLRLLSLIEGVSTLLLFGAAMPLKYFGGIPLAVTIAGSVHGLLFVALVGSFLYAWGGIPLPTRLTVAGIVGAVVPFGPFVVDARLRRYADHVRDSSA